MGVIGRLHRVADLAARQLQCAFDEAGLGSGEFDILATLRRAGEPYTLTPTQLGASAMVTSGAISKRVDRLAARGLVSRAVRDVDARGREVALTPSGLALVDEVLEAHVANEERLLAHLSADDRTQLAALLSRWLVGLDDSVRSSDV